MVSFFVSLCPSCWLPLGDSTHSVGTPVVSLGIPWYSLGTPSELLISIDLCGFVVNSVGTDADVLTSTG